MTASKNNSTDGMIEKLLERFDSGEQIDPLGQDILDTLTKVVEVVAGLRADTKLTSEKQTNKIVKVLTEALKERGVEGKQFYQHLKTLQTGVGTRAQSGANISTEDVIRMASNVFHSDVLQTKIAQQKGAKSGAISYASMETDVVQQALNNLSKRQTAALNLGLNNMQRGLISFFGSHYVEQDKKQGRFLTALIDAMANNKFIGGAFKDTLRLLGLMAGHMIKSKIGGPLGRILAGGTYALAELAASIVPTLLPMLLQAGITKLIVGSAVKQLAVGAGAAAGAGLGLETVVGATATATSVGLAARGGGILSSTGELYSAEKIAKLKAAGELKPIVGANGVIYAGGPTAEVASGGKVAQILTRIQGVLTKNAGWLSKITESPIVKWGGKLLRPLAYLDAVGQGWKAIKDFRQGNNRAGGWRTGAALTSAGGTASLIPAIAAAPETFGLSLLIPVILYALSHWMKGKADDAERNKLSGQSLFGGSTASLPKYSYAPGAIGTARVSNLQGEGGRGYVSSGTGLQKLVDPKAARVSQTGINFIKRQEGSGETAYWDVNGYATKWGMHKIDGKNVDPNKKYTQEQFNRSFNGYISGIEKSIRSSLKPGAKVTQGMIDAMADIGYNYGSGTEHIKKVAGFINSGQYEQAKSYINQLKANPARRKESVKTLWRDPLKAIPKASSHQTLVAQTPSVSSSGEEVKAPVPPTEEDTKAEGTTVEVPDLTKIATSTKETTKTEGTSNATASAGLSDSIMRAIIKGVDVPGNDTTFKVLTEMNNIALFGGQ